MKKFKTLKKTIKDIELKSIFHNQGYLFTDDIENICKEYRTPHCTGVYNKNLLETDALLFGYLHKKDRIFWYENTQGGVKIYCISDKILDSKDTEKVELYKRMLTIFNTIN